MPESPVKPIDSAWFLKGLAGLVLGFLLAIGCSRVFIQLTPAMIQTAQVQLAMWMVMPIWLTALGISFAFRTAVQTWLSLGILNLLVFSVSAL